MMTQAQASYISALVEKKDITGIDMSGFYSLSTSGASYLIKDLLECPDKTAEQIAEYEDRMNEFRAEHEASRERRHQKEAAKLSADESAHAQMKKGVRVEYFGKSGTVVRKEKNFRVSVRFDNGSENSPKSRDCKII